MRKMQQQLSTNKQLQRRWRGRGRENCREKLLNTAPKSNAKAKTCLPATPRGITLCPRMFPLHPPISPPAMFCQRAPVMHHATSERNESRFWGQNGPGWRRKAEKTWRSAKLCAHGWSAWGIAVGVQCRVGGVGG